MHSTKDICRLKCDTMTIMIYNFYVRETNGKKITNLHIALTEDATGVHTRNNRTS